MKLLNKLRLLSSDKSGNVAVELALIMSVFLILILGGFDFSRLAIEKHQLEQVARSAAQYGLLASGNSSNSDAIEEIAEAAAGNMGDDITVTSRTFCICPGQVEIDCSSTCADGSDGQPYLEVIVSKPYDFFFSFPALLGEYTLSGTAILPVP